MELIQQIRVNRKSKPSLTSGIMYCFQVMITIEYFQSDSKYINKIEISM